MNAHIQPPNQGLKAVKILTDDEEALLELPSSKIIEKLLEKRKSRKVVLSWFDVLSTFLNLRILALSAFIAAIVPIWEINKRAWEFIEKRNELQLMLKTAQELMEMGAKDQAKEELKRAEKISPSGADIQTMNALVQLSELPKGQADAAAVRAYERRFTQLLKDDPLAQYFMGSAFIESDLDKTQSYLTKAKAKAKNTSPILYARTIAGEILVIERRLQKTSDDKRRSSLFSEADNLFNEALQTISKSKHRLDFRVVRVMLFTNYSYIVDARVAGGGSPGKYTAEKLAKMSFKEAMKTGDAMLIGRSCMGMAENEISRTPSDNNTIISYVDLALPYLNRAHDEKGVYAGKFHRGVAEISLCKFSASEKDLKDALEGGEKSSDYRMQIAAHEHLGRLALIQHRIEEARGHWKVQEVLQSHTGTVYYHESHLFLNLLASALETSTESQGLEKLSAEFEKLRVKVSSNDKLCELEHSCEIWRQLMIAVKRGESITDFVREFNCDRELEMAVFKFILKPL